MESLAWGHEEGFDLSRKTLRQKNQSSILKKDGVRFRRKQILLRLGGEDLKFQWRRESIWCWIILAYPHSRGNLLEELEGTQKSRGIREWRALYLNNW